MKHIILSVFVIFFISCTNNTQQKLKIAVNSWIGYTPIFYAYEKGYLKDIEIKVIPTVSLGESADFFSVAKVDMATTTQHEYNYLKRSLPTIIPIILIDRSNGGDMILSNKTVDELQNSKEIYVYLEIDSINSEMIKSFINKYHINEKHIRYINKDQSQVQDIKNDKTKDIVIVTYTPYNTHLEKKGFKEIASTKDISSILVIDSIVTTKELLEKNEDRLKKLKTILDRSIKEIQENPKVAYKLTSRYLNNISFKEYQNSMNMIEWINNPSTKLLNEIKSIEYKEENLIK